MSEAHDKTWMKLAKQTRKGERHIISGKAADSLLSELTDERLAEEDLVAIVEAVTSGRPLREILCRRSEQGIDVDDAPEAEAVEQDVLQLNRNKGEADDSAEALADELRREALEDDEEEDA